MGVEKYSRNICFVMERGSVVIVVTASEEVPGSVAGEAMEKKKLLVDAKELEKCSCMIDLTGGNEKWKEGAEEEVICRICHLSSDQIEFHSDLIKLGCRCKGEIGIAHVHCGEAWFKLKGHRTCEICGEDAANINGIEGNQLTGEWIENSTVEATPEPSLSRAAGCWRGQPFCNFLMACLVIAFILPWFFRVKMF